MLVHNITGLVYEACVVHEPTGTRFSAVVTMADTRPRSNFDLSLRFDRPVNSSYVKPWSVVAIGFDLFAVCVSYGHAPDRAAYDWLPTMYIQAGKEFRVRFRKVMPHPSMDDDGAWRERPGDAAGAPVGSRQDEGPLRRRVAASAARAVAGPG